MSEVDWTAALAVLGAGLVAGIVLVLRARRSPAAAGPAPVLTAAERERRDREGRLDALLQQLRDLHDGQPETPARARDRYALELEAARALVALEDLAPAAAPAKTAARTAAKAADLAEPDDARERRAARRGFAWGFASAAALALLFGLVSRAAQPRAEGGSVTGEIGGGMPATGAGATAAPDAEEAALRAHVESNPGDVEARMELARLYLTRQDMMGVFNETQAVLAQSPGHPRALSYQSLVRLAMGQGDQALQMLTQALKADPDMLEAYLHMMLVQTRMADEAGAQRTMAEAVARFPAHRDDIERVMDEIRSAGSGEERQPEAAAAAPPPAAVPPAAVPPAAAGAAVSGVVESRGAVAPSAILFITVRAVGSEGGPPAAVKRLPARFPMPFSITAADSMMGQELPQRVRIEARVDSDGDPLTRSPQDPSARLDDVRLGTRDVRLVLQ